MASKILWSARSDQQLRSMRERGHTWVQIAMQLDVGRSAVIERARVLGIAAAAVPPPRAVVEGGVVGRRVDRPSMPPGHPLTWTAITAGTSLDGEPYPFPVFL